MPDTPTTPDEVREQATVFQTGVWYIAELDNPQLAVQSESEHDAIEKLVKRWESFRETPNHDDIRMGSPLDSTDYCDCSCDYSDTLE